MDKKILTVTTAAREHIMKMIAKSETVSHFHLSLKKTGCNGYMYMPKLVAAATEKDAVVTLGEGLSVLIPRDSFELLAGTSIDFQEKQWGMSQLTFVHPKAAGVCGCGESFNFMEEE